MKKLALIALAILFIGKAQAQIATQLAFKEEAYDWGMVKQGFPTEHIFEYTNTSTTYLTITDVKDNCSCTKVNWSKEPLAPGNTAAMIVSVNTNTKGQAEAVLTVTTNLETKDITLKFNVVSLKTHIPSTAAPTPQGE